MTDQRVTNYRSSVSGKRAKKASKKRRPPNTVTAPVTSSADTDTSGADTAGAADAAGTADTSVETPADAMTRAFDPAGIAVAGITLAGISAASEKKKTKKRKKRSRAITRAKTATSTSRRGTSIRR